MQMYLLEKFTKPWLILQAKKFVESLPQEMKNGVSRDEADKLAAALEAVGGVVEIV